MFGIISETVYKLLYIFQKSSSFTEIKKWRGNYSAEREDLVQDVFIEAVFTWMLHLLTMRKGINVPESPSKLLKKGRVTL